MGVDPSGVNTLSEHHRNDIAVRNSDLDQLPRRIVCINHGAEAINAARGILPAVRPVKGFYPVVHVAFLSVYRYFDFDGLIVPE